MRVYVKTNRLFFYFLMACALPLWAQENPTGTPMEHRISTQGQDQGESQHQNMPGMTMPMNMPMEDHAGLDLPSPHAGSGTAWQPASAPGYEWMLMRGDWELMAHGMIFLDYNQQGGPRGGG